MYVMVDIRPTDMSSNAFASRLLDEAGLSLLAGDCFGASGEGYLRFSLSEDEGVLLDACDRLLGFLESLSAPSAGVA